MRRYSAADPRPDPPEAVVAPDPVVLDGDTLTPRRVALIAREGALAEPAPEARDRNDAARHPLAALIDAGARVPPTPLT